MLRQAATMKSCLSWVGLPILSLSTCIALISGDKQTEAMRQPMKKETSSSSKVPTIVCGILKKSLAESVAVNNTWSRRCDHAHFFIPEEDKDKVMSGKEVRLNVKDRQDMYRWSYNTYKDQVDWYMACDDQTYVIMENLKHLLTGVDPDKPFYIRTQILTEDGDFISQDGSGFLLSREATRQLIIEGSTLQECRATNTFEEADMAGCLGALKVEPLDSFTEIDDWQHVAKWMDSDMRYDEEVNRRKAERKGDTSPTLPVRLPLAGINSVSLHHVPTPYIYLMEYLLYDLCVEGRRQCRETSFPWLPRASSNNEQ